MSWSNYYNTIKSVLTDNDYREIPENKPVERAASSHNQLSFMLKQIGTSDIIETTSNGLQYNHKVMLEVRYKNIDSAERNVNVDSYLNVFNAIAGLADYKGTLSAPAFEDIDDKHSKLSFTFLFGEEIEC